MSLDKYYHPQIEEFHVGFEFEYFQNNNWTKQTLGFYNNYSSLWSKTLDDKSFRVKYLDHEDIESLGWIYDNNYEPYPYREGYIGIPKAYSIDKQEDTGELWMISHYEKDNTIWIEYIKDCAEEGYIFKGVLKNTSDLKRLMKQLGITS